MSTYSVDANMLQKLKDTIKEYQESAEEKINQYLHGRGYDMFDRSIHNAMPVSGRKWKGKGSSARSADSLQDKDKSDNLSVTIRAKTAYGYLYFPDDGSNTERHYGNQQFFSKGVEEKADEAVDDMIDFLKF